MAGGRTKYAILSLLRLGDMSGAEIKTYCETRFSHFWNESYGQIYPALTAMVKEGLIGKTDSGEGKSVRYRITAKGRKAHAAWIKQTPSPRIVRDELTLKMFSGSDHPEALLAHIASAQEQAERQLDEIKAAKGELKKYFSDAPDSPYWTLMMRAGELAGKARLQWCKEATAVVNEAMQAGDAKNE